MNRRTARAAAIVLLLLLVCASLSGCGLYELLGIDTHDYESEPRLNTLPADGETAIEICDMLSMLFQNTPYLTSFDSPSAAAKTESSPAPSRPAASAAR